MTDNTDDDFLDDDDFSMDDAFDDDFGMDDFELEEDEDVSSDLESVESDGLDGDAFEDELNNGVAAPMGGISEKKSFLPDLSFNTIVIAGAVVLGAGVLLFQVMKAPPKAGVQDTFVSGVRMQGASDGLIFGENQVDNADIQNANTPEGTDASEIEQTDFLNNPDSLDSLEIEIKDPPPMPTPIVNAETNNFLDEFNQPLEGTSGNQLDSTDLQGPRPPADIAKDTDAFFNAVEEVEEQQVVEMLPPPELDIAKEPEVVEAAPEETIVVDTDVADEPITLPESELENSIAEIEAKNAGEIKELNETVASLRSEITRLKKKAKTRSAPSKASTRPKSIEWDLRAAQPGKAWISQKGSKQLQPVVVGDLLSGIGRVQDIYYANNRWVIKGSSKNIYQNDK